MCLLVGAGAARSAGLLDLIGLQDAVSQSPNLSEAQRRQVAELFASRNLEETLSYLRRIATLLTENQSLGEFTASSARDLHLAITKAIIPALDHTTADAEPFHHLASWASGGYYRLPIEIFTINYDLLLETGLEDLGVPYFDGFVGTMAGQFRPELVDSLDSSEGAYRLPATFVRLWKLHGSVNWEEIVVDGRRRIIRRGIVIKEGATAAIYPSDEKYDQSRRVPFVVLMDRLRRALSMPETLTLVAGYSFGDQHLNEMLFDAARAHPRSEIAVFAFGDIGGTLAAAATSLRNISVYGSNEAIRGGVRSKWAHANDVPGVWTAGTFQLVDFRHLTRFLATHARLDGSRA
ncbi:MAG TPA: SIR2 family protein [Thermoanaerobaculia bacterium]|nr:SIR2 family protein [Thermoanaerobaculia bacterium]